MLQQMLGFCHFIGSQLFRNGTPSGSGHPEGDRRNILDTNNLGVL